MAGIEEIAGMKLWAITRRGTKKDFVDLYFMLQRYSLEEMLQFFRQKFPNIEQFMVIRSLTYFEDAENDLPLDMIIPADWEEVKETIRLEVRKII